LSLDLDPGPIEMLAHSGAVISTSNSAPGAVNLAGFNPSSQIHVPRAEARRLGEGEIPRARPTVPEQLQQLRDLADPGDVDVLLLTGGANDFGFFENLIRIDRPLSALEAEIEPAFAKVPGLIAEARAVCRNAVIIYTGYYAGLSTASWDPIDSEARRVIDRMVEIADKNKGEPGADPFRIDDDAMKLLILNCVYFFHSGLRWLRRAVAEAMDTAGPPVLLAHPRFGRKNTLGAPESWIQAPVDRVLIGNPDDQYLIREEACPLVYSGVDLAQCVRAATFHPNAEGAIAYRNATVHAWDRNRAVRLSEIAALASGRGSVRSGLERYSLHRDASGRSRSRLRLRSLHQHLLIDTIAVTLKTGSGVLPGTLDDIWLEVGLDNGESLAWLLSRWTGRSDPSNSVPSFWNSGEAYTFVIDPCFDSGGDRVALGPLQLSRIRHLAIRKRKTKLKDWLELEWLPKAAIKEIAEGASGANLSGIDEDVTAAAERAFQAASKTYKLARVHVVVNEAARIYDSNVNATLNFNDRWQSGRGGSEAYPLPA
jgi:hypothetical protein